MMALSWLIEIEKGLACQDTAQLGEQSAADADGRGFESLSRLVEKGLAC